jgi:type I restriction enzyme S subunit
MNKTILHTTKYKNSPLGLIPEDWEVKTMGELGSFSKGKGITKEQLSETGFPCIRYGEIYTTHDFIIKKFKSFINENVALESKEIKKGDILFAGSGETVEEIGKAVAYLGDEKAFAGGDVIILNTKNINVECLSYALEIDIVKKQKRVLGQGNSVVHIYSKDLAKLKLPIPPLSEQKAIADCLSTWDQAIEKQTALIAKKELSKKALMQQLLSGKRRLKGFEVQKGTQKTEFGYKIPKDWKIVNVSNLFIERSEKSNNQDEYPLFSLTIEKGLTEKTDRYERSFLLKDKENNQYKIVYPNDILFNPMNLRFGAIAKSEINIKVLVSGYYNVITTSNDSVNLNYFIELFKSPEFNNFYDRIAIGSLMEKKRVHLSNFIKLQVPLPSNEEQTAIANVLQCADEEIQLLKKNLNQLKEQKKGLMQVLLTGKKRLKY